MTRSITVFVTALLAIAIGLYAFAYLFVDFPFFSQKGQLLNLMSWKVAFYAHVIGGGIALSIGWTQFWRKFRQKSLGTHRLLGKIYIIAILIISAPSSFYLALNAIGPFANDLGFALLAIIWFTTTVKALIHIQNGRIEEHKKWMTRSYAATFAAVTLRLWMPILIGGFSLPFSEAYAIIAWLSWVPNMIFAEWIINKAWVKT